MGTNTWKFSELKVPRPSLDMIEELYKDAIERVENATNGDDVLEVVFETNLLVCRIREMFEIFSLRYAMDTTNERYEQDHAWAGENQMVFDKLETDFKSAVYDSPYKDELEEQIGHMYFVKTEIKRKTICAEIVPLRQHEEELVAEYDNILFESKKTVDGKECSIIELQDLFSHEDRAIRKEAFKAFSEILSENEEGLEKVWDELIKVRTEIANVLGYDSYVPVGYLERESSILHQALRGPGQEAWIG